MKIEYRRSFTDFMSFKSVDTKTHNKVMTLSIIKLRNKPNTSSMACRHSSKDQEELVLKIHL